MKQVIIVLLFIEAILDAITQTLKFGSFVVLFNPPV